MKTSYCKSDDEYKVKLCVRKIGIEYVGNSSFPFCCDITTQDDKFFRCAVRFCDIAQFALAQENDVLSLKLGVVFEKSLVMGVVECQNLTHQWKDIGLQEMRYNKCSYFEINIHLESVFFLSLSSECTFYPPHVSYCILSQAHGEYVCFYTNHTFMPDILGAKVGDDILLKVGNWFEWGQIDVLQVFDNKSRKIDSINQLVRDL